MNAETIEGTHLSYVLVQPEDYQPDESYPLIILLHGFGANMYDLTSLCPAIDRTGYVYALPNAPYQVDLGGGFTGSSWALNRPGMPPVAVEQHPTAEERLLGFIDEVTTAAKAEPGRVLLGGFSQGGGMTLRVGLPRPELFAGLVVMSGAFRETDSDVKERLPADHSLPIFISHGLHDRMVTLERGEATRTFLEEAGYEPVYKDYDMGHEIADAVISDLVPWLKDVLPPRAAA